jgi:hypothetical protein
METLNKPGELWQRQRSAVTLAAAGGRSVLRCSQLVKLSRVLTSRVPCVPPPSPHCWAPSPDFGNAGFDKEELTELKAAMTGEP